VVYINKKRRRQGKRLFEPLYTTDDALKALKQVEPIDYGQSFSPTPGATAHFRDAGHMLGSTNITLDIDENGQRKRLAFSGDVGRKNLPILRDPQPVEDADFIIMEGTYGNRLHAPIEDAKADLTAVVNRTFARGGVIIIPAFAVGRTQEIVYALHQIREANEIPQMEIYVDSPLAVNVTDVFARHPEVYDQEMHDFISRVDGGNAFGFDDLNYVRSVDQSKSLNHVDQPVIIISASGMCEAGRILHHLKHHISDERNTVLFVGYQGEQTLGRKILEGQSPVPILGDLEEVRAEIHKLEGYSGHADRNGLLAWLRQSMQAKPAEYVFVVHCEPDGGTALLDPIKANGVANVFMPARGQTFEL
jgi:metallo-beta-lactamase family protein